MLERYNSSTSVGQDMRSCTAINIPRVGSTSISCEILFRGRTADTPVGGGGALERDHLRCASQGSATYVEERRR